MKYPQKAIEQLQKFIESNDLEAFNWLIENNFKELTYLKEGASGDVKCLEWLLANKHFVLGAFINSIWEDAVAFQLLIKQKEFCWAATANIINGDEKAEDFLVKAGFKHFVDLAYTIQAKIRREGDEGMNIFKMGSPFKLS